MNVEPISVHLGRPVTLTFSQWRLLFPSLTVKYLLLTKIKSISLSFILALYLAVVFFSPGAFSMCCWIYFLLYIVLVDVLLYIYGCRVFFCVTIVCIFPSVNYRRKKKRGRNWDCLCGRLYLWVVTIEIHSLH